ncbi:MAG: head maturation protease, ClpP-related [Limnohabitans sp.]
MKKTWYSVTAKAADSAEISIYDEIGFFGVTAKDFITDLKQVSATSLTVFINSPGGSVFDGLAIYNALRQHPANVTVKVMGVAASAASFIAMAGDKIVMPENSFLMVHNPMGGVFGNAQEMRDWADTLDKIAASLIGIYVARTGKSEDEIKALLDAETWLTASEAVEMGFADEMEAEMRIAASFDVEQLPEAVRSAFAQAEPEADSAEVIEPIEEDPTFADQVAALATAAGLTDYTSVFALSADTVEAAQAAMNEAREIISLCAVAKRPEAADGYVRARLSLASVRERLINAQAEHDEQTHTDTAPRNPASPAPAPQSAAVKTADIWAARRSKSF